MKRKLRKEVRYGIYVMGFIALVGIIYSIEKTFFPVKFNDKDNFDYVNKTIVDDDTIPVVSDADVIIRPYTASNVAVIKGYYDYESDSESQEKSLIYSEKTYLQSTGVSYSNNEVFDIVSILDGVVISVKEDTLLGKVLEVRHTNDVISVYQSLSEILVKENDMIQQGSVIGKAGMANISPELNNHLHFELIVKGTNVNPENYYDKKLSEI